MYTTSYVKASDVADATTKLGAADDGKLLAGGQTLLPTLKQRLANPDQLIDLAGCGLSGVSTSGDAIKIGAMTCHADVASHKDVAASQFIPANATSRPMIFLSGCLKQPSTRMKSSSRSACQTRINRLISNFPTRHPAMPWSGYLLLNLAIQCALP